MADSHWTPLPDAPLSDEQRLHGMLRLIDSTVLREVVLYEHGTCVLVLATAPEASTPDAAMRFFDVPLDGQGGPPGDLRPMGFDDGSVLFVWADPEAWTFKGVRGPAGASVASVLSASEIRQAAAVHVDTPGEVFAVGNAKPDPESERILRAGLFARRRRTLDAKACRAVLRWTPDRGVHRP